MTPEEIAGCFLDYRDHFGIDGKNRRVAIQGLERLLKDPENERGIKIIQISATPDFDVLHTGYLQAAEAFQKAPDEVQDQVRTLMDDNARKTDLIQKAQAFLVADPTRVAAEAKKEKNRSDLANVNVWTPENNKDMQDLKERCPYYDFAIKEIDELANLEAKGSPNRKLDLLKRKQRLLLRQNPNYLTELETLRHLINKDLRIKAKADESTRAPSPQPSQTSHAAATEPNSKQSSAEQAKPEESSEPTQQESPERSSTFQIMFGNINIPKEYQDARKMKFAQMLYVHNSFREAQINKLQEIKEALLSDHSQGDLAHAKIFYGVLKEMKKNLETEFRWLKLLGISKHSRLEDIIEKHIIELESNPDLGNLKKDAPISKDGLRQFVTDFTLMKKISQLIEPRGFINTVKDFLKDSADSMMHRKPKNRG